MTVFDVKLLTEFAVNEHPHSKLAEIVSWDIVIPAYMLTDLVKSIYNHHLHQMMGDDGRPTGTALKTKVHELTAVTLTHLLKNPRVSVAGFDKQKLLSISIPYYRAHLVSFSQCLMVSDIIDGTEVYTGSRTFYSSACTTLTVKSVNRISYLNTTDGMVGKAGAVSSDDLEEVLS